MWRLKGEPEDHFYLRPEDSKNHKNILGLLDEHTDVG